MNRVGFILGLIFLILGSGEVRCAETQPAKESPSSNKSEKKKSAKPGAKGRKPREKEAEGTEAADRFEADTVIKSKYRLNGESLEVDPD